MIRLLAICLTTIMLVGCQHPNSTPTYDPFAAAGSQRIPPPATGFNQSSGYQGAPSYQPPITQQPPAAVPPTNNYQPPVSYQAPSLTVPQIQSAPPATGFPPTNSSPATLQPVSPNSGVHWDYSTPATATASRSTPTPRATPSWPPRRPLRQSDQLTWSDPQVPGGVRHAAAQMPYGNNTGANRIPTLAPASLTVRPSVVRSNSISPIPGRVAAYDEAYLQPSVVPYPANQSYGVADQWRSRQR